MEFLVASWNAVQKALVVLIPLKIVPSNQIYVVYIVSLGYLWLFEGMDKEMSIHPVSELLG